MAKIIDLNTMVKEDLVFKLLDGKEVRVPGQVSTYFVLQLTQLQQRLEDENLGTMEQMDVLLDMVTLILSQDPEAGIDREYVDKHLSDVNIVQAIVEAMTEHISNITEDENL